MDNSAGSSTTGAAADPPPGHNDAVTAHDDKVAAETAARRPPSALAEYAIHRTQPALHFSPPLHLTSGMQVGRTYLVTITAPIAETVSWKIYGPPGDIHSPETRVEDSGGTRLLSMTPTTEGRFLIAVEFAVNTFRTGRQDLRAFRDSLVFPVIAVSEVASSSAFAASLWPWSRRVPFAEAHSRAATSDADKRKGFVMLRTNAPQSSTAILAAVAAAVALGVGSVIVVCAIAAASASGGGGRAASSMVAAASAPWRQQPQERRG